VVLWFWFPGFLLSLFLKMQFFHQKLSTFMKSIKTFLLATAIVLTFSSCCQVLQLCDLAINSLAAPETIQLGQVANLVADVINQKDDGKCDTDIAGLTKNLVEVFLKNNLGDWEKIDEFEVDQDAIEAGGSQEVAGYYTPTEMGEYRWDFYDDFQDNVEERDDNNNYACSGCLIADRKTIMRSTNNFRSAYTTVVE